MLFQLLVYVLIPSCFVFFLWGKKKLNSLQAKGVLCLEPSFPLGSMNGVGRTVHLVDRTQEIYDAFKKRDKIAGFYMLLKPTIMLLDLDLIKNVLIKDFHNFTDRGVYSNKDSDPVSAHMFALEGAEWKFIRTKLSPTFTTGKIKAMFGTVVETSEQLVKAIDSEKVFEVRDLCNRYICDVIGSVAFGLDCEALKNDSSELLKAGERVFHMKGLDFARFFFVNSFMELSKALNMRLMSAECSNYFIETVREAIKYREENNIHRPDFLNSLIQLKNTGTLDGEKVDDDKKLTFNQIVAEAFLFYFAGIETSSTTMSFALLELAINRDVQSKVRDEVKKTLEKYDGKFTYESVAEMTYLNQVFNETLRKYATVGTLTRVAKNDYKVPETNHVIPAGTQLFIPVFAIHRDEGLKLITLKTKSVCNVLSFRYLSKPLEIRPRSLRTRRNFKAPQHGLHSIW